MLCLRIGLDQKSKSPPYLVSFGRRDHNDITNEDEDGDGDGDGERKEKLGYSQISRARRQCVVLLRPDLYHDRVERQWLFQIRDAEFRLLPGTTHGRSEAQLTKERLAFARNTNNDGTIERTLQQLGTLDLQSKGLLAREPHSTWFRASPKREKDKVIRIKKLKPLGRGGQGEVHEVVDMYTGAHYACKIVDVRTEVTQWKIHSEIEFKMRVKKEVEIVQKLTHPHIVPYTHTQESKTSHDIQIFMPVYEGNLHDLLQALRDQGQEGVRTITSKMLYQMLQALDFVHTHDPPIIHRDVKPPNILHRGGNFFLIDFGIAKAVDASNTVVGTGSQQTPKVDIWGLGVTVVEFLEQPEDFRTRQFTEWEQWYEYLQTSLNQHHFPFASMVTVNTDRRPTARDLLQSWRTNVTLSSAAPPLSHQLNGTTTINSASPILMDWTQTVPTTFVQLTPCDESM
ncbi:serine/threonine protein kinase [Fusarium oxysporum]|nr:serine/threonine protein kinase [Fusarium oxysporum]